MNINDTLHGSNGTYQLVSWFEDGPAGQIFEARARFVNGEEADVLVFGAPLGSSQLARTEFLAQGQRVAQIHAQLTQRGEERAIPISYEMSEADLFFVITRPTGTPLTEQIVLNGSLPEQEALLLARRMSALLDVLHEELGLAAAPQGFLQVRWEGQVGDLWLPVWHAAAPISPARRHENLLEIGATMHLAMLGHKPRVLWRQPVTLPKQHPDWSKVSRGAQRLLQRLLHPHPDYGYQSAGQVGEDAARLLQIWREASTEQLLSDAETLLAEAQSGDGAKAEEADAILDVLARREKRLPWQFAALQEDVARVLSHERTVESALQLVMAGSRQVAVDHLHQALNGACNRLALLRWSSLLSDEAVDALAMAGPGLQMLRSTITALEADDFDAAWIAARSLEKPPQSLQAELDVQQAWRAAVASADDPEVALVELDRATQALEMVSDPVFRKALSESLGELSRWRWLAATSLVERQREEHVVQALSRIQEARQGERWAEATTALQGSLASFPRMPDFWNEAQQLGIQCLIAGQPEAAQNAFAMSMADGDSRWESRLGWRSAQALTALYADPLNRQALASCQMAIGELQTMEKQHENSWLLPSLRSAIVSGLNTALERVSAISAAPAAYEAATVIHGELRRLGVDLGAETPRLPDASASGVDKTAGLAETPYATTLASPVATIHSVPQSASLLKNSGPRQKSPWPLLLVAGAVVAILAVCAVMGIAWSGVQTLSQRLELERPTTPMPELVSPQGELSPEQQITSSTGLPEAATESTPTAITEEFYLGPKPVMPKAGERPLAETTPAQRASLFTEAPDLAIDPSQVYVATFKTAKGDIVVELYAQQAPTAVNNFVTLANMGYYDGLALHPADSPQAILGGDPSETGQGSPGYEIAAERTIPVVAGTLGYLRLPEQANPEGMSNGSQFFITMEDIPDISGVFSAFGQVIEGLDVAAQIAEGDTIEQIVITEAAASQAPTPGPLPTATTVPTPFAPDQSKTGDRPLAKLPAEQRNGMFNAEPAMQLEFGKDYVARITTDVGDIVVDLYEDQTPVTVNNFVTLANLGFYDNTTFHRVVAGLMAQAGDPTGTGTGGPGYQFADEIVHELVFDGPGILAMANAGANTNGSQFFITFDKTDWLNGQHTIFGKVTEGQNVLTQIKLRDPQAATEPGTTIETITIETK